MMLYVVATPIGNLSDLSDRAKKVLSQVSCVACEDTRRSRILLAAIGSNARAISYHAHSKPVKLEALLQLLDRGEEIALISDAGTPGINDPGGVLVDEARRRGHTIVPIPGPSAVTTALSASGFANDRYLFAGFLPKKKGRQTAIQHISQSDLSVVVYESPQRVRALLTQFSDILEPTRRLCVCRELTKQFEQIWVGTTAEAPAQQFREQGEFVIVVEGQK